MLARDIVLANLEHANPERPGLTFSSLAMPDGSVVQRINDVIWCGLGPSKTFKQRKWVEGTIEYHDDEWGNIWHRKVDGSSGGEIFQPALKNWKQLDSLVLPDYDDPDRYKGVAEAFARPTDKFKMVFLPGWVFATSRYLRKMEVYFVDLIECREEIDRLHAVVTDLFVRVIHRFADCGAEGIFYCEDLGTQNRVLIGPRMWRDVFKPHYDRLVGAAHERNMKVFMHSCGYNWDLLDDLIAAGIDCFQFDQPAAYDMPALAAKLRKHKVALWAPVDIQKVMPTGDRAFIESEARRLVETFRGGLILKNYDDLHGIGVKPEWDMWAYNAILRACGIEVPEP
jgi:uroporphyrinogen decarboxylase